MQNTDMQFNKDILVGSFTIVGVDGKFFTVCASGSNPTKRMRSVINQIEHQLTHMVETLGVDNSDPTVAKQVDNAIRGKRLTRALDAYSLKKKDGMAIVYQWDAERAQAITAEQFYELGGVMQKQNTYNFLAVLDRLEKEAIARGIMEDPAKPSPQWKAQEPSETQIPWMATVTGGFFVGPSKFEIVLPSPKSGIHPLGLTQEYIHQEVVSNFFESIRDIKSMLLTNYIRCTEDSEREAVKEEIALLDSFIDQLPQLKVKYRGLMYSQSSINHMQRYQGGGAMDLNHVCLVITTESDQRMRAFIQRQVDLRRQDMTNKSIRM